MRRHMEVMSRLGTAMTHGGKRGFIRELINVRKDIINGSLTLNGGR